jgi:hypothetical protein
MSDQQHPEPRIVSLPAHVQDGIAIMVTRAFCPNGHNLVKDHSVLFGGHPGISILLETADWSGEVILSPFQGDPGKWGMDERLPVGTLFTLRCPICKVELPVVSECGCEGNGKLVGFYLRPDLRPGDLVMVCNRLGCRRSKVLDSWQILSEHLDDKGRHRP